MDYTRLHLTGSHNLINIPIFLTLEAEWNTRMDNYSLRLTGRGEAAYFEYTNFFQ